MKNEFHKIYLVGYGPGDPEYMTLKADRVLNEADVIFYDFNVDILFLEKYKAHKEFVGKKRDNHCKAQDEINELLFEAYNAGNKVVRLKGGDPSIFGRLGEELDYLLDRGVDVEIIPGITTGFAASSILQIPLTERKISSSLAFCSGHLAESIIVPKVDTIVYYMCAQNAQVILHKLLENGWLPDSQVLMIHSLSLDDEKITISSIYEELSKDLSYESPLVILVGKTVDTRKERLESLLNTYKKG